VELGPLMRDATVKFHPAVFLANAMAAFILNLVRAVPPGGGTASLSRLLKVFMNVVPASTTRSKLQGQSSLVCRWPFPSV